MTIQTHLNKIQTINQGSFYTPDSIVGIAYQMLLDSINNPQDYVLLDSSCGYGSFLQLEGFKQNIGTDIDEKALKQAKENFKNFTPKPLFIHTNALADVQRDKFRITESNKLIIIGNPPYNDKTSIVQNHLKNSNSAPVDSHLQARDIGISFLRSFDALRADYICVLHPLSYLIKESNFKALKDFSKHYRLIDSMIISSAIFCPKSMGYFPIIIALYERDNQGMDYDFILNFTFHTLEGNSFKLNDFDFIAKYIDKYPNKKRVDSQVKVAMFYTLRDINALRRSKTFITKENSNTIYVSKEKYSLYCYIDVFKMMIAHTPYYLGNCDILIDFKEFKALESAFIKASESKTISPEITEYFRKLLGKHYED
ncbi:Eco57I restriction-modification methylase domain-containing protein [Helicobacter himalayensis]|uniref:Eco57I restriction-modification methylase domain-containing protein n=1 Tax=Helicobacter himalayensis TaxID=1591088 RepID=UPI000830815A|nr:N-6 DNA methylase [Helicobacter himalayensis]